jgi:hypothetical protein
MTNKEKELLLRDLCARLPYNVKCFVPTMDKIMTLTGKRLNYFCFHDEAWGTDYSHEYEVVLDPLNDYHNGYVIKPYLRPMSSMTEEEKITYIHLQHGFLYLSGLVTDSINNMIDWLNSNHFDYRGLIEKGLAIEVDEGNNPYNKED